MNQDSSQRWVEIDMCHLGYAEVWILALLPSLQTRKRDQIDLYLLAGPGGGQARGVKPITDHTIDRGLVTTLFSR